MHKFVCFNHEIADSSKVQLPAVSSAAFYGRGVFTTVAIYDSKFFQWARHWRRLTENAKALDIDLSKFTEEKVLNSFSELISTNDIKTGRARLTFFDESAGGIWQTEGERQTSLLIVSADFRIVPSDLRLSVSPFPVNSKSPLAGVKSCNYLENLLAFKQAGKRGFDEAIRLNEKNEAVSATMANIFWTRDGEIFTPPLETGALAGTTRDFVLKNFPVSEKKAPLGELQNADEIFLTSAGLGVLRVGNLDNRNFTRSDGFLNIQAFFENFVYKTA